MLTQHTSTNVLDGICSVKYVSKGEKIVEPTTSKLGGSLGAPCGDIAVE